MQLDKVIAYHKALSDPLRVKMLVLLARGELSGQELAEKLHVTPPTVTHHAAKLREAALIMERRERNTIYLTINEYFVRRNAADTVNLIFGGLPKEDETMKESNEQLRAAVLKNFFTKEGKLKHLPAQYKKKLIVLERLVSGLDPERTYAEAEMNEYIKRFHPDFATIRREFIMHRYMFREQDRYEVNPREMWTRWEDVGS
jgi:hypothetical protein